MSDDPRLHLQPGDKVYLKDELPEETCPNDTMRAIAGTEVTIAGPSDTGDWWYHIKENGWNYYYTAFQMPAPDFSADECGLAELYGC